MVRENEEGCEKVEERRESGWAGRESWKERRDMVTAVIFSPARGNCCGGWRLVQDTPSIDVAPCPLLTLSCLVSPSSISLIPPFPFLISYLCSHLVREKTKLHSSHLYYFSLKFSNVPIPSTVFTIRPSSLFISLFSLSVFSIPFLQLISSPFQYHSILFYLISLSFIPLFSSQELSSISFGLEQEKTEVKTLARGKRGKEPDVAPFGQRRRERGR